MNYLFVSRGDSLLGSSGAVGRGLGCGTSSRSFVEMGRAVRRVG